MRSTPFLRCTALSLIFHLFSHQPAFGLRVTSIDEQETAGLEELKQALGVPSDVRAWRIPRRQFLRMARAGLLGLLGSRLLTACAGLTPRQMTQPGPVGAFAVVRQRLGKDRSVGIDVVDPGDLLLLESFFPLAAKTGFDAVWIRSDRFRRLPYWKQWNLLNLASRSGLKTIGFTEDGSAEPAELMNRHAALLGQLSVLGFKALKLKVTFAIDIQAPQQGDLTSALDLIRVGILPQIRRFAYEGLRPDEEAVVEGPLLILRGDRSTFSLPGWRPIPEIEWMVVSEGEDVAAASEVVRQRAQEGEIPFQIGVGAQPFQGKEEEMGPAIVAAYDRLPEKYQRLQRGVAVVVASPLAAQRILTDLLPVRPSSRFRARVIRFSEKEMTLALDVTAQMLQEEWVAALFVKTTAGWIPTASADKPAIYPVRVNGRVTIRAPETIPLIGGSIEGRAIVFLPLSQVGLAQQAYRQRDPFAAMQLSFQVVAIGEDGSARVIGLSEVIQELRSSGLEEQRNGMAVLTSA